MVDFSRGIKIIKIKYMKNLELEKSEMNIFLNGMKSSLDNTEGSNNKCNLNSGKTIS